MKRSRYYPLFGILLSLSFIGGLLVSFAVFYSADPNGSKDPLQLPSFTSTNLLTGERIARHDLTLPAVINLWASWCTACLYEHPLLMDISEKGVIVYGINHQDNRSEALEWIAEHGNPFTEIIEDKSGFLGNILGIYGLPETLLIDAQGNILVRHRGLLTPKEWQDKFLPVYNLLLETI